MIFNVKMFNIRFFNQQPRNHTIAEKMTLSNQRLLNSSQALIANNVKLKFFEVCNKLEWRILLHKLQC